MGRQTCFLPQATSNVITPPTAWLMFLLCWCKRRKFYLFFFVKMTVRVRWCLWRRRNRMIIRNSESRNHYFVNPTKAFLLPLILYQPALILIKIAGLVEICFVFPRILAELTTTLHSGSTFLWLTSFKFGNNCCIFSKLHKISLQTASGFAVVLKREKSIVLSHVPEETRTRRGFAVKCVQIRKNKEHVCELSGK